ncbi:MAG TPA: transposase [Candidatus Paceibacterota bacterium]
MRKTPLVTGEFYHVYNRGVDKRKIFNNHYDLERFLQSMEEFNSVEPIGSIYENSYVKNNKKTQLGHRMSKLELVEFITYCLNQNHYHLLLRQKAEKGIERFMQKLGNGYTKFFNNKYKRSGVLFQGSFKSIHVESNEYLLHLSAYINLNNKQKNNKTLSKSSWEEYTEDYQNRVCKTEIILDQFKNKKDYKSFAESSLEDIIVRKKMLDELEELE